MARVFNNYIDASPSFKIDIIVGGFYTPSANKLIAWTQERNVLKIDGLGVLGRATIDVTAGLGLADEITVSIAVSFASSQVQYVDITDVFRSVFDRSKQSAIADTATHGSLSMMFYDTNDVPIVKGPTVVGVTYYDALTQAVNNDACVPVSDRWLLPDTFRIPDTAPCVNDILQASTRMTRGSDVLEIISSSGNSIDILTSSQDQRTYGWEFDQATYPAVVRLTNPSLGVIESARVISEQCKTNTIVLTWWSPVIGGWKSVVAEVVGDNDDVSDSERYIIGWDYGEAKGGMLGLRVKIPNCTPRDYAYYRDIYYSAYVQVYDEALWAYNQNVQYLEREVMVVGTPPQPKLNGYVDLEMTLKTAEVSSIW